MSRYLTQLYDIAYKLRSVDPSTFSSICFGYFKTKPVGCVTASLDLGCGGKKTDKEISIVLPPNIVIQ